MTESSAQGIDDSGEPTPKDHRQYAVIVTPGGIGTCLELFYTWQLMQVGHIKQRPLILLGSDMWKGLMGWLSEQPLQQELMSVRDFDMLKVVDSVDEVLKVLEPEIEKFRAGIKASSKV